MANKEKHRLKRQEKQRQLRKLKNQSPWQRLEQRGVVETCLVSNNWRTSGLAAVVFVLREPNGQAAVVSFEIDVWCMGLRAAAGQTGVPEAKISELHSAVSKETAMLKVTPEEGQKLVAAGIRFAQDNQFRLPGDWRKLATAVGVETWDDADLSDFRKDGKLCYVGPLEELEAYHLGNIDAFLQREDVNVIARAGLGQDLSVVELRAKLAELQSRMSEALVPFVEKAIAWCREQNEEPSPLLAEAATRISTGLSMGVATMDDLQTERLQRAVQDALSAYLRSLSVANKEIANRGAAQFLQCIEQTESLPAWVEAVAKVQASLIEPGSKSSDAEPAPLNIP